MAFRRSIPLLSSHPPPSPQPKPKPIFFYCLDFCPTSIVHSLAIANRATRILNDKIDRKRLEEKRRKGREDVEGMDDSHVTMTAGLSGMRLFRDPTNQACLTSGHLRLSDPEMVSHLLPTPDSVVTMRVPIPSKWASRSLLTGSSVDSAQRFKDLTSSGNKRLIYAGLRDIAPLIGIKVPYFLYGRQRDTTLPMPKLQDDPWYLVVLQHVHEPRKAQQGGAKKTVSRPPPWTFNRDAKAGRQQQQQHQVNTDRKAFNLFVPWKEMVKSEVPQKQGAATD